MTIHFSVQQNSALLTYFSFRSLSLSLGLEGPDVGLGVER